MSNILVLNRIESNLTRLRLPKIREILEPVLKTAENQDKSHLSFLDELLEEEVAAKEQRRIETSLKISAYVYPTKRKCDLSGTTWCRQNTSGRLIGIKGLSVRDEHLLYQHGRSD